MEIHREYNIHREQYLAMKLLPRDCFLVLDLGSGLGEFSDMLKERGYSVVAVEGNEEFVKQMRQRGLEAYCCDFEKDKLPFDDNTFDGVVCLDVIEHVWNTDNLLSESKRILKPGGWLLLTTPNHNWWRFRIQCLMGEWPLPPITLHKRSYNVNGIQTVLSKYYKIEDVAGVGNFPKIGNYFTRFKLNFFAMNVIIRCRKS